MTEVLKTGTIYSSSVTEKLVLLLEKKDLEKSDFQALRIGALVNQNKMKIYIQENNIYKRRQHVPALSQKKTICRGLWT